MSESGENPASPVFQNRGASPRHPGGDTQPALSSLSLLLLPVAQLAVVEQQRQLLRLPEAAGGQGGVWPAA